MNYIVSLATKSYIPYILKLFRSIRGIGWRGEIILFTPDDNVYCNEKVIKIEQTLHSPLYTDCRWLVFELINYFKDGDKVLFFDADCVLQEGFPIDTIFDYDFVISPKYRESLDAWPINWELIPKLTNTRTEYEYVPAPFLWTVNEDTRKLFKFLRLGSYAAFNVGGGIIVTLTSICMLYEKKVDYYFPYEKVFYTTDELDEDKKKNAWLLHYGGKRGKELWQEDYL